MTLFNGISWKLKRRRWREILNKEENEHELFLRSLAPAMEKMTEQQCYQFRIKI
jgi:hypothetical protein